MKFSKVAILGAGLLGGSLAKALAGSPSGLCGQIALWARRDETVEEVKSSVPGVFASTDIRAVVEEAELVIVCTTIGAAREVIEKAKPFLSPFAIVTDVGSVKAAVCQTLSRALEGVARFVGSHPMAGSEQSGFASSTAGLFAGAVCVVTPDDGTDAEALKSVEAFWRILGMRVLRLNPFEHDEMIACISHLPHITSACLVQAATAEGEDCLQYSGGGFRDTTRIAEGPPEMWAEILIENRSAVLESLRDLQHEIHTAIELLEKGGRAALRDYLMAARSRRIKIHDMPK